jgi:hypothetical protein
MAYIVYIFPYLILTYFHITFQSPSPPAPAHEEKKGRCQNKSLEIWPAALVLGRVPGTQWRPVVEIITTFGRNWSAECTSCQQQQAMAIRPNFRPLKLKVEEKKLSGWRKHVGKKIDFLEICQNLFYTECVVTSC